MSLADDIRDALPHLRGASESLMSDQVSLYEGEFTETFDPATGQTAYGPPPTLLWSRGGRTINVSVTDDLAEQGWDTEEAAALLLPWDAIVEAGNHAHITDSDNPLLIDSWWQIRAVERETLSVRRRCIVTPVTVEITAP